ncbi:MULTISPECIES: Na+/H+ antiporter NhaC family protein [unclassified Fusibacter]|uniref:Na+/H+ antiporter NhaC family protein n=1 Tax=unclassified Fusibacter TaxID=2624464 RepID=UPI001011A21B|nr:MULTISPECIES: Na+/H+ antiporter NhaC family protein [unclassified Fusibacter]MCK8058678.1 sodium:proton antiporter [Fusibacter sp. A2]NPE21753.1 sodium:proton antiporter [Fusibacter sp. A1]RXV61327.1 sodium:proton antiporter [Fusibacter sp. A1]
MKKSIVTIGVIVALIGACVYLQISLFWGFLVSNVVLLLMSGERLVSMKAGIKGLMQVKMLYFIILLLGANITIWLASGIIPTIVYYGFTYIDRVNLLFVTFTVTALVSSVMGTGLGTLSTIGLAFFGIGMGLGYPAPILLGAIVSGAFVSDKISPVSALTNLTIEIVDVSYRSYFKVAMKTLGITLVLSALVYFVMNGFVVKSEVVSLLSYKEALVSNYRISFLLLLLPVMMIVLAMRGVNVLVNMMFVFVTGSVITLLYQGVPFDALANAVAFGYKASTDNAFINSIFKAGGMVPMLEVILIVMGAVFLNSLLMSSKLLDPVFERLLRNTTTPFSLILKTGLISMFLTSMTCDQTVGIVVPGETLADRYESMGLSKEVLARTISDTGTIIAPLQFWNVNALIITGITGVSAIEYAPFAVLCYLSPLMTLLIAKHGNSRGFALKSDQVSKKIYFN